MAIILYRRHERTCKYRKQGSRYWKCNCPIWTDGIDVSGKRNRVSLKTRDWDRAEKIADGEVVAPSKAPDSKAPDSPLVPDAVKLYLESRQAKKCADSTVIRYRFTLDALAKAFPKDRINSLTFSHLEQFQNGRMYILDTRKRKMKAVKERSTATTRNEIDHLRLLWNYALKHKWVKENPADLLEAPKNDAVPTQPFDADGGTAEMDRIVQAAGRIESRSPDWTTAQVRAQARALVLVLASSGLRISDTVKLARASVNFKTGQIFLRMAKTGEPVYSRLRPEVLAALSACPKVSDAYFFWDGLERLLPVIERYRKILGQVFKAADIEGGHPHRLRDTFAVTLLNQGVNMRTVQLLLGHTMLSTTEKHYAPFVKSMQPGLDAALATLPHYGSSSHLMALMNTGGDADGDSEDHARSSLRPC